jgi:hypothetical protein
LKISADAIWVGERGEIIESGITKKRENAKEKEEEGK